MNFTTAEILPHRQLTGSLDVPVTRPNRLLAIKPFRRLCAELDRHPSPGLRRTPTLISPASCFTHAPQGAGWKLSFTQGRALQRPQITADNTLTTLDFTLPKDVVDRGRLASG